MSNFKMYDGGVFQISGELDPKKLLKVLGKSKSVSLVTIKSGGCSENLYMKEFEKRQGYKGDIKNYIEMQTLYNDFLQKCYYGQDNYYYGNGFARNYCNPHYLHG